MFTAMMMVLAAYVAVAFDVFVTDLYYGGATESLGYYMLQPWRTVQRTLSVIRDAIVSLYWRARIAVEDAATRMWDSLAD